MTAIMYRSFADSQGFNWPPEIAYTVDGKPVTFAEIKAKRVAAQRRHLDSILRCDAPVRRAAFVWTFFVEGPFYGGWHLYLRTIKQKWWIRHYDFPHEALVREIMNGKRRLPNSTTGGLPVINRAWQPYGWTFLFPVIRCTYPNHTQETTHER
jgi:hypothetical protein